MNCNRNHIDTATSFNPKEDIYPCWCGKFYKSENKLMDAIHFLQYERMIEILSTTTKEEVLKHEYVSYDKKQNILDRIFMSLQYTSGSKIPSLDNLSIYDLLRTFPLYGESVKTLYRIIQYLCFTYPELIKQDHFYYVSNPHNKYLFNILSSNFINDNDDNICIVCNSSHRHQMLNNLCSCKYNIHLQCFISSVENVGSKCLICKKDIKYDIDGNRKVFFPDHGIYPIPLMSNYCFIDKSNKKKSLEFACLYLAVDNVRQILDSMTHEEFMEYKKGADTYSIHKVTNDGFLCMSDTPCSNMSRYKYSDRFTAIELLLKMKEISI